MAMRASSLHRLPACARLAVAATLLGYFFGDPAGRLPWREGRVLSLTRGYIRLVFLYFAFTAGLNILSAIMHGNGNTRTPMEGVILVNVLHVRDRLPADLWQVWLSAAGGDGCGVRHQCSEFCGCLYLLIQALRQGYLRVGKPDLLLFRKIWQVGYPVALKRVAQQSGQLFYSKFIIAFGTAAYAAHQIGLSIESLSFMPGAGMGIAAATLMGQALGARKIPRPAQPSRGAPAGDHGHGLHGAAFPVRRPSPDRAVYPRPGGD